VYGPQLYYGSARIEHNKLLPPSFWIPTIDFFTSIFASIMIYQYLGAVLYKTSPEQKLVEFTF
jgi:hypothetical protein